MPPFTPTPLSSLTYGEGFFLRALLSGAGKSGKTTSAATFPGKKLLIDCDRGKEVLYGRSDVDVIEIEEPNPASPRAFLRLIEVKKWIETEMRRPDWPYDCLILDTMTRIYDAGMYYAMLQDSTRGPGGSAVGTHYKIQKKECVYLLEFFLHLPIHLIACVHEHAEKDELLGKVTIMPAITGKDAERITERFRENFHCFSKNEIDKQSGKEKSTYWWRTMPDLQRPYLGSSLNTDSKYWGAIVEPNFAKLFALRGISLRSRASLKAAAEAEAQKGGGET